MTDKDSVLDMITALKAKNISESHILEALLQLHSEHEFYKVMKHLLEDLNESVI